MNIINASIPIFFALIFVELIVVYFTKKKFYRLNDSLSDLSAGTFSQIMGIFLKLFSFGVYFYVQQHFSIQNVLGAPTIPNTIIAYAICFVLVDFAYYWFHRMSHETALGWSFHVVHHQSEEYNLSVALRQSAFGGLFSFVFYLPIAVLGFPVEMYLTSYGLNLLYQFWIHTRTIGKLHPWVEYALNTPSHHRVHHGKNPKYCDRNHAGVFMFWDRMFGTFVPEQEEPVYGITVPLNSWSPLYANIAPTFSLVKEMWAAKGMDKLRVLFNKPGWRPSYRGPSIVPVEVNRDTYVMYDPIVPAAVNIYLFFQFVFLVPLVLQTLNTASELLKTNLGYLAVVTAFIILSLSNIAAIHEGKNWAWFSEVGRIFTVSIVAAFAVVAGYPLWGSVVLAMSLLSATYLILKREAFWQAPQTQHAMA